MGQMGETEAASLREITTLRAQSHELQEKRRRCQAKQAMVSDRHKVILKELLRIEGCDDAVVDTDVWVNGYMQRGRTEDVMKHFKKEVG
jgi:hypothetical protein